MDFQFFRRKLGLLKYEPEELIKNKMTMSKLWNTQSLQSLLLARFLKKLIIMIFYSFPFF